MKYKPVSFWPNAYHVYQDGQRVGIVNCHHTRDNGRKREVWFAHNKHFFSIAGEFPSRAKAAAQLSTAPIHHDSNAFH